VRQPSGCRAEASECLSGGAMAIKRPPPFSLRLTFEQRTRLEEMAGDLSLGGYVLERLFAAEANPSPRRRSKHPVKDHQALAQVLGLLGKSRLSSNLNQLAHSANSGSLPVTPDTEMALLQAAADVREMRKMLIAALNLEVD
jgi:hypothetical protein